MHPYFRFNFDKAVQAIAVLMRSQALPKMNYMRLLKLLYLAERKAIKESGRPIIGSPIVAMKRGPIVETVYKLILGQHFDSLRFSKFFERSHYDLVMTADPGMGRLSEFEIEKLQEVASEFADCDEWDLVWITHELPEWKKNDPGDSCRPIPLVDLLEALGMENADAILEDARNDYNAMRALDEATRQVSSLNVARTD
jgi:uncharacterized phage-associated protein